MTTSVSLRAQRISSAGVRTVAYWTATLVLAVECFVGGAMGAVRLEPFKGVVTRLGYPVYFMTILGVCYISAGITLLVPRFPRLKEWAYAGLTFVYIGAVASHIWVADDAKSLIGPLIFLALAVTSWALRPQTRRDFTRRSDAMNLG